MMISERKGRNGGTYQAPERVLMVTDLATVDAFIAASTAINVSKDE